MFTTSLFSGMPHCIAKAIPAQFGHISGRMHNRPAARLFFHDGNGRTRGGVKSAPRSFLLRGGMAYDVRFGLFVIVALAAASMFCLAMAVATLPKSTALTAQRPPVDFFMPNPDLPK